MFIHLMLKASQKLTVLSIVLGEIYYDKTRPLRFGFHSRKTRRFCFTDLQENEDQINIQLKALLKIKWRSLCRRPLMVITGHFMLKIY